MVREIQLTQGKVALVDDADFEWLNQWKWHARFDNGNWYAERCERQSGREIRIPMQRQILNTPTGKMSDHRDGNGLNNQRHNLRACSHSENLHNQKLQTRCKSSRFKGVYWVETRKKWRAGLKFETRPIFLGHFNSEVDAAVAYNKGAVQYFGEFARLNIIT